MKQEEVQEKMKYITAGQFKSEIENELMDFSQIEPLDFSKEATAKNIRMEAINEDIGLDGPKGVIKNILYQMQNEDYIRTIASDPFNALLLLPIGFILKLHYTIH